MATLGVLVYKVLECDDIFTRCLVGANVSENTLSVVGENDQSDVGDGDLSDVGGDGQSDAGSSVYSPIHPPNKMQTRSSTRLSV